jgi:pSer/pThr/pTyr-binding forkhead associated (FHA) protein
MITGWFRKPTDSDGVHATDRMNAATASGEAMMAAFVNVLGGKPGEPQGYLVVDQGGSKRSVPIFDQLFVGRECAGISEPRRLVIDDPEISRTHLEIRLDAATDQAMLIDTSSNGTLLNGVRLERAVTLPIRPDANVAFRLSGLAGRDGRAAVLVTSGVHRAVAAQFNWGAGESVEIKGRHGMETVFPVIARKTASTELEDARDPST